MFFPFDRVLPYVSHIGMCRPKGYMVFGLKSGMVFEETTGTYERIYRLSSK